jgi:hypothetical protein
MEFLGWCRSIDFTEAPFVRLRVISWIESFPTAGDPLNHTKNHEKENGFLSFHKLSTWLASGTVIFETLSQVRKCRLADMRAF